MLIMNSFFTNLLILLLSIQFLETLTFTITLKKLSVHDGAAMAKPIVTNRLFYDINNELEIASSDMDDFSFGGIFESKHGLISRPYVSQTLIDMDDESQALFCSQILSNNEAQIIDPLWEQIKLEAKQMLENEPSAGPQLYTLILSQPSLIGALTSIVSHEIETELIPATSLQNLFIEMLHPIHDIKAIALDVMKVALRSSSKHDGTALNAVLFHQGLHALVCHRLSHRLWLAERTGLAYYIQSTVSRKYSTDIHPAAKFGYGIYLNAGSAGVVVGETAIIDHDVTILQGVTLGGTGKERGNRHPKISRGVVLQQSCSVLGNIRIGQGAIITAKSIVTKDVPEFARVSGIPGKVRSFVNEECLDKKRYDTFYEDKIFDYTENSNELERSLIDGYLRFWNQTNDHIV